MNRFNNFNHSSAAVDEGLKSYILRVYNLMFVGLIVTAIAGYATLNFLPLKQLMYNLNAAGHIVGLSGFGVLLNFAPIGIAFYFGSQIEKLEVGTAQTIFLVYSATIGMAISSVGLMYTNLSIARAFLIAASMFGAMSIYGYTTKRDLTAMGSLLIMVLFGMIISSIINIFLASSFMHYAISFLGIFVFTGLIAYDTQKIKSYYYHFGSGETAQKYAVLGALGLYTNFINLFLSILRFVGDRK